MKKYLKMADVFIVGLVVDEHIFSISNECMSESWEDENPNEYAAHAINSHDELVQMNRELLEIINRIIGTSKELQNKLVISGWACGYKQCAIDTGSALRELMEKYKEKGGAA